jgi:hypothetical protein
MHARDRVAEPRIIEAPDIGLIAVVNLGYIVGAVVDVFERRPVASRAAFLSGRHGSFRRRFCCRQAPRRDIIRRWCRAPAPAGGDFCGWH